MKDFYLLCDSLEVMILIVYQIDRMDGVRIWLSGYLYQTYSSLGQYNAWFIQRVSTSYSWNSVRRERTRDYNVSNIWTVPMEQLALRVCTLIRSLILSHEEFGDDRIIVGSICDLMIGIYDIPCQCPVRVRVSLDVEIYDFSRTDIHW